MLTAEITSTTAKPSMILPRKRRVGRLIDRRPPRFATSYPRLVQEKQTDRRAGAPPVPRRKPRAEWIMVCKFSRERLWLRPLLFRRSGARPLARARNPYAVAVIALKTG